MVVINIYPKDLCVVIEHRVADLRKIHKAMNHCTLKISQDDAEQVEADRAFHDFYNTLDEILKDLEREYGA
jgi:hypothetical protein